MPKLVAYVVYPLFFVELNFNTHKCTNILHHNPSVVKITFNITCTTKMDVDFRKIAKYLTSYAL